MGELCTKNVKKKKVFVEGNPSALYQCIGKICINTINVLHWCATIDKFNDQKPDDQNYTLTMKGQNELVDSWQTNFVLISDSICSPIVLMTFSWMSMSHTQTHKHNRYENSLTLTCTKWIGISVRFKMVRLYSIYLIVCVRECVLVFYSVDLWLINLPPNE